MYTKYENFTFVRFRIVFKLNNKGACVPFHHQHLLFQFLKKLLEEAGQDIRAYSNYNFSGIKGQTKVSRNGLHFFSSKVTLVISGMDEEFLHTVLKLMFSKKEIKIAELNLTPEFIEKENSLGFEEATKFLCLSPMVLVNPETDNFYAKKFISPDLDIFSDLLYESTLTRMEKTGHYTEEQIASFFKFQVVPDKIYLKKIRRDEKKFARIYSVFDAKRRYELRGYTFPFTLYADPTVQEFVFNCGLGAYTFRGFGMVDLANVDPIQRSKIYQSVSEIKVSDL